MLENILFQNIHAYASYIFWTTSHLKLIGFY